ncbi:unnamed protein product [Linum tenue]|uniref:Secreted protein n=1 Tax=Linum tenue TaxID=586396 RepID=A0AAV0HL49_9ROSI|nr:unnamed protein product [Linum tenue]
MVMQASLAMWTLAPMPSTVLKLFMMSSCFSVITMSLSNTIHSGLSWITAWRSVPVRASDLRGHRREDP